MPGIGLEIEGAMQHAPQSGRHAWSGTANGETFNEATITTKFPKHNLLAEASERPTRIVPSTRVRPFYTRFVASAHVHSSGSKRHAHKAPALPDAPGSPDADGARFVKRRASTSFP